MKKITINRIKIKGISQFVASIILISIVVFISIVIFGFMREYLSETAKEVEEESFKRINWLGEYLELVTVTNKRIIALAPGAPPEYTVLKVYVDGREYRIANRTYGNVIVLDFEEPIPSGDRKLMFFTNTKRTWVFDVYVIEWEETKNGWLDGFRYKREIVIDNSLNQNNLTDYQVLVTLNTQNLISQGKMRSDCGDIRLADSDMRTLLNYWIKPNTCGTSDTRIWVRMPSISAGSTKKIYMFYGNASLVSTGNGYNTFLAFNLSFDGPIGGRVSLGGQHSCALLSNGSVMCWGNNWYGQLGDGTGGYLIRNTPVLVLNYNLGGRYEKTGGITTPHRPPYFFDTYFVRRYSPIEPTITVGEEISRQ
ncbi:MAG: DUF2341 domain-containing protein [Candidatus Aenigmarchaeota archaeon]|nr:DUF2341 domain-containing protein [Candidatus Aenigmarchaeota archaeon]MDW8160091.1 DUF2341 domain-containing protein [Candidatus Aenigmarchaeota archaeon]